MILLNSKSTMEKRYTYDDLLNIIAKLRSEEGCPWDREQTHESLKTSLLEESYELIEAINNQDVDNMREELGDVLLQVLMHAQIGLEENEYNMDEIINELSAKLVYRHPHVFGTEEGIETSEDVSAIWEILKAKEKNEQTPIEGMDRVAKALPALVRAQKVQKKAAKSGLSNSNKTLCLQALKDQINSLSEYIDEGNDLKIEEEIGELLFKLVNLSTFFGINAEFALTKSVEEFINRFRYIEN